MRQRDCIAVFAYSFPHRKTQDFLFELALAGFRRVLVLAAPWKELRNGPSESFFSNGLSNAKPHDTAALCEVLDYDFVEVEHGDVERIQAESEARGISLAIIAGARILKSAVINVFKEGVLNIHPGKIPETSGLDAFFYSIKHKAPMGATAHFVDGRVDAGVLLFFEETPLNADDTPEIVQHNNYQSQIRALRRFIAERDDGQLVPVPAHRPHKNQPMKPEEKRAAIKGFGVWRSEQLAEQVFNKIVSGCEAGRVSVVSAHLDMFPSLIERRTKQGWTPLIVAAFNQHLEVVELLLERGADPNASGRNGTTPVMYAKTALLGASIDDRRLIQALFSAGADLNRTDCFGKDVFHYIEKAGAADLLAWMQMLREERT